MAIAMHITACAVIFYTAMACVLTAYTLMARFVIACVVMAYIIMDDMVDADILGLIISQFNSPSHATW